jgi:hypothetical protein
MEPESSLPAVVPILIPMNAVHTIQSYLAEIHFNIILTSTSKSYSGIFPYGFLTKILYAFPIPLILATSFACLIFSLTWSF